MEDSSDRNSGHNDNDSLPQASAEVETDPEKINSVETKAGKSNPVESSESLENSKLIKVEGTENNSATGSEQLPTENIEESSVITSERGINKMARASMRKLMDISRKRVVFSYGARERPRQPFMGQGNQRNAPPPLYYTEHKPRPHDRKQQQQNRKQREYQRQEAQHSRSSEDDGHKPYRFDFSQYRPMMPFFNFNRNVHWASYPPNISDNVPSTLALLVDTEALFIIQQMNLLELFIPDANAYLVLNKKGECLYYVYETFGCAGSCFCSNAQALQLHVIDVYDNEVIYMSKSCGDAHMFCCYPVLEIYSPSDVPIGAVTKSRTCCIENFRIIDPDENTLFKIHGEATCKYLFGLTSLDITIHALDPQKTPVGLIRREFVGIFDHLANIDYYGISFPRDMDVRLKACFLGAALLFDLLYFE